MTEGTQRFYRYLHMRKKGLVPFHVKYRETDLWIRAERDLRKEAGSAVLTLRYQLDAYISARPEFLSSLLPIPDDPLAPPVARHMLAASSSAGVGPMAAVAGAIAQAVGIELKEFTESVIVENGGDCYLDLQDKTTVGLYAGANSPFTGKLGLYFSGDQFPLGICTSSGTIGHSLSFGIADAVTVISADAALSDATATLLGNMVKGASDIAGALDAASLIPSVRGALIVVRDKIGAWGDIELRPL